MPGYGKFITPHGIQQLKNYKYKSGAYTHGDNFMQPFWNWFVTLFPMVSLKNDIFYSVCVLNSGWPQTY